MLTIILEDLPGLGIGQYHIIEAAQLRNPGAWCISSGEYTFSIGSNIFCSQNVSLSYNVKPRNDRILQCRMFLPEARSLRKIIEEYLLCPLIRLRYTLIKLIQLRQQINIRVGIDHLLFERGRTTLNLLVAYGDLLLHSVVKLRHKFDNPRCIGVVAIDV